jgi:gluconate 2-dehydrogenase gamma chain
MHELPEKTGHEGQEFSRRRFVKIVRDSALILILPQALGCRVLHTDEKSISDTDSSTTYQLRFLTLREKETVETIAARIIPSDEKPGAREAGVVNFIDHMLATTYAGQQQLYRDGVRQLDHLSQTRFNRHFMATQETDQDALLAAMERNQIPDWKEAGDFFSTIRAHTIEGIFSEPKYFGNANRVGWQLLDV